MSLLPHLSDGTIDLSGVCYRMLLLAWAEPRWARVQCSATTSLKSGFQDGTRVSRGRFYVTMGNYSETRVIGPNSHGPTLAQRE